MISKDRLISKILNRGRAEYLKTVFVANGCCSPVIDSLRSPRFDVERAGIRQTRDLKECDLLIVSGYINYKYADKITELYEKMNEPKWVIAVGNCACSGGIYSDSDEILKGLDKIIPVDIFVPGCSPRPEAVFNGILQLKNIIRTS